MSKNEKIGVGTGIALATLILTMVAMVGGGAVKCGQVNQELADHGARLDKIEPVIEVVHELNGKMDIMLEMLKEK